MFDFYKKKECLRNKHPVLKIALLFIIQSLSIAKV
jgi:hypothetical protein